MSANIPNPQNVPQQMQPQMDGKSNPHYPDNGINYSWVEEMRSTMTIEAAIGGMGGDLSSTLDKAFNCLFRIDGD